MYTDEQAKMMAERAGELYQPSNGTEGEIFMGEYCENCKHDNLDPDTWQGGCDIIARSMAYGTEDKEYPREWIIGNDGHPTCTAFEQRETNG